MRALALLGWILLILLLAGGYWPGGTPPNFLSAALPPCTVSGLDSTADVLDCDSCSFGQACVHASCTLGVNCSGCREVCMQVGAGYSWVAQ